MSYKSFKLFFWKIDEENFNPGLHDDGSESEDGLSDDNEDCDDDNDSDFDDHSKKKNKATSKNRNPVSLLTPKKKSSALKTKPLTIKKNTGKDRQVKKGRAVLFCVILFGI